VLGRVQDTKGIGLVMRREGGREEGREGERDGGRGRKENEMMMQTWND